MATFAARHEDYSIGVRSGTMVLRNLVLTAWGAADALETFTDHGRLWGRFTASSGLVELFRDPALASGDRVLYATVTSGVVASFTADNSSGFGGSCKLDSGTPGSNPESDCLFDVIVSYASEKDLKKLYAGLEGELDSSSKYEGEGTRFEELLKQAKRLEVDPRLHDVYGESIGVDSIGRPNLAYVADPRQLADAHAHFCVYLLLKRRANFNPEFRDIKNDAKTDAEEALGHTAVNFDYTRDGTLDNPTEDARGEIERG